MDGFMIRTKSGDKGPYDIFQLEKLVAAGKIPRTISVIDPETDLSLPLEDLLPEPPPPSAAATAAPKPPAPPPPPPPSTPPSTTGRRAPVRGGAKQSKKKIKERMIAHKPVAGAAPLRTSRYVGSPHKKSPVAAILLTLIVLGVVGGGGGYILWRDIDRGLEGTWRVDMPVLEMLHAGEIHDLETKTENATASALALTTFRSLFEKNEIRFGASDVTFRFGDVSESGPYRIVSEDGGRYVVEFQGKQGPETWNIEIDGRRLVIRSTRTEQPVPMIRG